MSIKKYTKKTAIVATIGPATSSVKILAEMAKNGMSVARLNFSHGDAESIKPLLDNIRKAEKESGERIAILQDLSGPKMRTGDFENGEVILKKGKIVKVYTKKILGNSEKFSVSYKNLLKDLKKDHRVLLNDGKQELKVLSVEKDHIKTKVVTGGFMRSKRGFNLPDSDLSISSLTKKDKMDILFGIKENVEYIAFSFVKTVKDVKEIKDILKKAKSKAMVISKIETPSAVKNFDEILEESDAIMVARGDLAVEVNPEKVPMIQKMIIKRCNAVGKPVITATQMMDSMINSPVPTRAEVSDISNAILDGTDAVMLSEETAMGKYPLESVIMMSKISLEVEKNLNYKKYVKRDYLYKDENYNSIIDSITRYAAKTSADIDAKAIIALTETGTTARMIARYRSRTPIFIFSPDKIIMRQAAISFNSYNGVNTKYENISEAVTVARDFVLKNKIAKKGDDVVIVAGIPFKKVGGTNTLTVFKV